MLFLKIKKRKNLERRYSSMMTCKPSRNNWIVEDLLIRYLFAMDTWKNQRNLSTKNFFASLYLQIDNWLFHFEWNEIPKWTRLSFLTNNSFPWDFLCWFRSLENEQWTTIPNFKSIRCFSKQIHRTNEVTINKRTTQANPKGFRLIIGRRSFLSFLVFLLWIELKDFWRWLNHKIIRFAPIF